MSEYLKQSANASTFLSSDCPKHEEVGIVRHNPMSFVTSAASQRLRIKTTCKFYDLGKERKMNLYSVLDYISSNVMMIPYLPRYWVYRKKYDIHKTFSFGYNPGIFFYGEGKIVCGENSYIGRHSSILAFPNCRVVIGKQCSLSHYLKIYTMSWDPNQDMSLMRKDLKIRTGDVLIGDYSWVGINVYIGEGVTIGENSVIGANSVVTRSIPPHSIAAGSPAKVLKFKS